MIIAFLISIILVFVGLVAGLLFGKTHTKMNEKTGSGYEQPGSLEYEYRRYVYVQRILTKAISAQPDKEYEVKNIIERWLLTMANVSGEMCIDEVFANWTPNSAANLQMAQEFAEKTKLTTKAISALIDEILSIVAEYKVVKEKTLDDKDLKDRPYEIVIVGKDKAIFKYADYSREISISRMKWLRTRGSDFEIARMLLRYASILPGSQHWNMPISAFKDYYEQGIRIEGFASPVNAQLVTIDKNCHFCSLFPDVDKVFGSIGRFFDVDFAGDYPGQAVSVGPPYTDEIFLRIAEKLELEIRRDPTSLFYVTFAAWEDAPGFKAVLEVANYAAILPRHKHFYVNSNDPAEPAITARFNTAFFVVGRERKDINYNKLFAGMAVGKLQIKTIKSKK